MGSDHVAMANCGIPKVANELRVLKCQSRNAVSLCKHWRGPGEVLLFSMKTLCEALNIYKHLLIYFLCCCNSFTILIFILQIQTQQSIMAESLIYKPRMDLSNNILFRLSLYYVSTFRVSLPTLVPRLSPKTRFGSKRTLVLQEAVFQLDSVPQISNADSKICVDLR